MMERPDDLKVDWASPVVIMDNGDHMEALVLICQWFYYHAQGTFEMLITIVSKPVVPFFCHADRKEGPGTQRHFQLARLMQGGLDDQFKAIQRPLLLLCTRSPATSFPPLRMTASAPFSAMSSRSTRSEPSMPHTERSKGQRWNSNGSKHEITKMMRIVVKEMMTNVVLSTLVHASQDPRRRCGS